MKLTAGDWTLDIDPVHGGMIRALERGGSAILRAGPTHGHEPFESACFPLAPYVNRIAHGRFTWEGQDYQLAPNHAGQTHPLHGTAWLGTWQVTEHSDAALTLAHQHTADAAWPWSFDVRQRFSLTDSGLEVRLTLHNTDSRNAPAGLGFHPWFSRKGVQAIAFEAQAMWLADADMLPTHTAAADTLGDWSRGAALERPDLVDHCYSGWNGALRIARTDGDILLEGDNTPFLHLYVPPGEAFFCAEPQDTMPDAVNRDTPAPLAPDASRSITMRIRSA